MSGDTPITRLPPPPPLDPLRTASIDAVQAAKREHKDEGQADDEPAKGEMPAEPEDQIDISGSVPDALQDGLEHPDKPDAFMISLDAVQDLLDQHRADYAVADFGHLQGQLAFLQTHAVPAMFWPPSVTLQQAIDQACHALAQTVPLLPPAD